MKKVAVLTALAAACLLATPVMAQDKAPAASTSTMTAIADAMGVREKAVAVGVIQSVDLKNRLISIKNEDGKIFTIKAGPEVQNLAQIGPGSVIKAEYHEAVAVALNPVKGDGINVREDTVSVGRTAPGQLPGATIEDTVKMLGTIAAIDPAKHTVLLQGAVHHVNLKVAKDVDLKNYKVGDQITAVYVQELGIAVGPAPTPSYNPPKVGNQ